jgi:hypothetical protein
MWLCLSAFCFKVLHFPPQIFYYKLWEYTGTQYTTKHNETICSESWHIYNKLHKQHTIICQPKAEAPSTRLLTTDNRAVQPQYILRCFDIYHAVFNIYVCGVTQIMRSEFKLFKAQMVCVQSVWQQSTLFDHYSTPMVNI